MSSFHAEAEACMSSAPVGMFGIDDLLIAIEIASYAYQLWHACEKPASAESAKTSAKTASLGQHEFKRARRCVRHAGARKGVEMTPANQIAMTAHMLKHVQAMDSVSLGVCCAQPPIEDDFPHE